MPEDDKIAYDKEVAMIEANQDDPAELQITAIRIRRNWMRRDVQAGTRLMLKIAEALNSKSRNGPSRLAQEWLLDTLREADGMPLELEFKVATALHFDGQYEQMLSDGTPVNEAWRSEMAKAWLHPWKRLRAAFDPQWDEADLPSSNVVPPQKTGLPSGVSPDAIEDPELRAEYERSIERNNRKAEQYRVQYGLRKLAARYLSRAEKNLFQLYCLRPYNTKELETLLEQYVTDATVRSRILSAVREEIAGK